METILVLIYTTGSRPLSYAYSYTINFYSDATASIKIYRGYENSPTYSDKTDYDTAVLENKISILSALPEHETTPLLTEGERREIIYVDNGRTLRRIITPEDRQAIKVYEQLLLLFDEDFQILISNQTYDT